MALKVLHLIDSGGLYGAENMLLDLVAEQQRQGMRPLILSAGTPDAGEKPLEAEARRRDLPVMPFRMRAGLNFRKGLELLRFAQREGFDVLHSHGYKFNILLGMLPRGKRTAPLVATMHGYVQAARFSRLGVYRRLERLVLRNLDGVVFVSSQLQSHPLMRDVRMRLKCVIDNGLDTQRVEAMSLDGTHPGLPDVFPGLAGGDICIGAIGRLSGEKGFDLLIDAFARLAARYDRLRLVIIGEGGARQALEHDIERLGLAGKVVLPGYVSPVQRIMRELHGIVMPSRNEGLPVTLLEAVALGKPVVASRVGGIPDVLDRYSRGVLVEPGDPVGLADAIERLLLSREERETGAEERLDDRFTASVMAARYEGFYRRVLGAGHG